MATPAAPSLGHLLGRAFWPVAIAIVLAACTAAPVRVGAQPATIQKVSFSSSHSSGTDTIDAVIYKPANFATATGLRAVVMMHGCTGMWSERNPDAVNTGTTTPNLQNHIDKWGIRLSTNNIVALAVDSYTTRREDGAGKTEWQNQCVENVIVSGTSVPNPYATKVSPYSTRVDDARAGYAYLVSTGKVDAARVGLLGWSQGAEAVMTEAAVTPNDAQTPWPASHHIFLVSVIYYPGCGGLLGFNTPSSPGPVTSFWRPYRPIYIHVGKEDHPRYETCSSRYDTAIASYPTAGPPTFFGYDNATHSFDAGSQAWITPKCSSSSVPPVVDTFNNCAMRSSDIDSFAFFQAQL